MSRVAAVLLLVLVVASGVCRGDTTVISLNSLSPMAQNFDGMGNGNNAVLPLGWQLSAGSNFDGVSSTDYSAGTRGDSAINSGSPGGFYNFGDGVNAQATDRAPGFLIGFAFNPNKSLFVGFRNNTGSQISDVQISYDIEKYRKGLSAADINFYYAFDGITWVPVPDATQHYPVDSSSSAVDPATSINRSAALSGLNIPHQGNFYFRWQYASPAGSNGQGLGIDNFSISFSAPKTLTWFGPNGGNWDDLAPNWKDGAGNSLNWNNAHRDRARFAAPAAGVGANVNISAPRMVGGITFDSGTAYTISGNSLTVAGAGEIHVTTGAHNIAAPLILEGSSLVDVAAGAALEVSGALSIASGKMLSKVGAGALRLSGAGDFGSQVILDAGGGTVYLASTSSAASLQLNIDSASPGTDVLVVADADQDLSELSIVNGAGKQGFDLHSPVEASAFRSIRIYAANLQAAKDSLNAAIWSAVANPQDGIFDSSRAAHFNSAIGVGIFNDHLLIRPTRMGDVNLDGSVTIADFIGLATNFNRNGLTWQEGDINGDGSVTIADFIALASNFNTSYSGAVMATSMQDRQILENFAAAHAAAIPEPAFASLAFLAALVILGRRRVQSAK